MAQRSMDNGKDETRGTRHPPLHGEERGPDVAPPGSRERAEAHISGWTPEKEAESIQLREGPFHRAAIQRLYNPRGGPTAGDVGPGGFHGPRSMEERDDARRPGPPRRGGWEDPSERDLRGEALSAEYRAARGGASYRDEPYRREAPADVRGRDEERYTGRGDWDERPRGRDEGRYTGRRDWDERPARRGAPRYSGADEHFDPALGLDSASPGIPGEGVGPGALSHFHHHEAGRGHGETQRRGRRWAREPLTAREIMTRGVKTVRRDSPLREVAQLMRDEDCGVVPITDERGTLLGLVTDRDLVIRAFTGTRTPDALRAGDVMTDDVQAVTPDEDIHSIIELMGRRQVRRVPVVDRDDRLLGIISMGDIANRAEYDEELQEALARVSSRRSFWHRLG